MTKATFLPGQEAAAKKENMANSHVLPRPAVRHLILRKAL